MVDVAELPASPFRSDVLAGQVAFVTPTSWERETVARFAFLHPGTTPEIVAEILSTL